MKPLVVVVEDDANALVLWQRELKRHDHGVDVEFFDRAKPALEFISLSHPQAILTDFNLVDSDAGAHIGDFVKAAPGIPVVAYSSSDSEDVLNKCYMLGAISFVNRASSISEDMKIFSTMIEYWGKVHATTIQLRPR